MGRFEISCQDGCAVTRWNTEVAKTGRGPNVALESNDTQYIIASIIGKVHPAALKHVTEVLEVPPLSTPL